MTTIQSPSPSRPQALAARIEARLPTRVGHLVSRLAAGSSLALLVACGSVQVGTGPDTSGAAKDVEVRHEECNADASDARRVDANGDSKPDIVHVMDGGREVCRVVDLNLDGAVDAFIYYDAAGQERRRESDFDRDGRADEIVTLQGGVVVSKERETNFDGKLDTWDTYAGSRLTKRERDTDGDAIIDQWWEFNSDDPKCAVVSSDKNADGKPDLDTVVDLCADPNAPTTAAGAAPSSAAPSASAAPGASAAPSAPAVPSASASAAPAAPPAPAPSGSAAASPPAKK